MGMDVERNAAAGGLSGWLAHPDNEPPQQVAVRFGMSEQWASEHVGPHRCVDDHRYTYSCLVSDPSMDRVARSYMRQDET